MRWSCLLLTVVVALALTLALSGRRAPPADRGTPPHEGDVALDADDLLDRFAAVVAGSGLGHGERIHATDDPSAPAVDGTRLVPLSVQSCPVAPPDERRFAARDVVVAPGRLACSWTHEERELSLTVLLDADLEPMTAGATADTSLPTRTGAGRVEDDGSRVWLQSSDATRLLRAELAPWPGAGDVPVTVDLPRWLARLEPSRLDARDVVGR